MDLRIQIVTFAGCPNAGAARAVVERVLTEAGISVRIDHVDTTDPEVPEPLRSWGSPTILLNGDDVGGESEPKGRSCRLYRDEEGRISGAPSKALVVAALERAMNVAKNQRPFSSSLSEASPELAAPPPRQRGGAQHK